LDHYITFDGKHIYPSEFVKWLGVWLDPKLNSKLHIKKRAGSAARALNVAMALTHASWGLKPILIHDLARVAVFLCADYGVNCFFPLGTGPQTSRAG
jgi:hypothetical protein